MWPSAAVQRRKIFQTLPSQVSKKRISMCAATRRYWKCARDSRKSDYFVDRLVEGTAMIASAFYPKDVILAEEFAAIFDGFSIGSNDLPHLLLGVDRDSEIVSPIFDERNEAMKKMIGQEIHVAREKGSKIEICGQAPSDYPEFAKMLDDMGIHSISVTLDVLIRTKVALAEHRKGTSV